MKKIRFEKTDSIELMGSVYKDILEIKVHPQSSFKSLIDEFYTIMLKHGICQGKWHETGRILSNAEWIMCWNTFTKHTDSQFMWLYLAQEPPEQLLAYGNPPLKSNSI